MKIKIYKVSTHKFRPNKYGRKEIFALSLILGDWVRKHYYDVFIDPDLYTHFFFNKEFK